MFTTAEGFDVTWGVCASQVLAGKIENYYIKGRGGGSGFQEVKVT